MRHPRALVCPLLLLVVSCGGETSTDHRGGSPALPDGRSAYEASLDVTLPETSPTEMPGVANLFRLSERIVSGGEPHGEEALRDLSEMGIKTILSVDGKVPDSETAAKYGMRYVHVPIQYSGISPDERVLIAKTFRELPGPFYVHCFHGKHRGPAAAAWGRVVLDGASREQALAEMRQWCGTSMKYRGLYETVARADVPSDRELRALDWDFPSAHRFEGFRQAMIGISRTWDHLKALEKRDWAADPDHPDISATNEAAKLADLFQGSLDLEDVGERPEDFRTWLSESLERSRELRDSLEEGAAGDRAALARAASAFRAIRERCDTCHGDYRNE